MSFDYSKQRPATAVRPRRPGELIVPNRPDRTATNAAAGWETLGGGVVEGAWFQAEVELPDAALIVERWRLQGAGDTLVIQSIARTSPSRLHFNIPEGAVELGDLGVLTLLLPIQGVEGQQWQWR